MNEKRKSNPRYIYYESCSTSELANLLRMDIQSDDTDSLSVDELCMITEILSKRENNKIESSFDPNGSWEVFKKEYLPIAEGNNTLYPDEDTPVKSRKTRFFRPLRNIAAVLIVCCVVFSAYSVTTIAEGFFTQFASWSNDNFWFGEQNITEKDQGEANYILDISDYFNDVAIPENLLPAWLPEEFLLTAEDGYTNSSEKVYQYCFNDYENDSILSISVSYLYSDITNIYEKDDFPVTRYEKDGIFYYFISNANTNSVIWKNGSFECQIDGTVSEDILMEIIESIPTP